MANLAKIMAGDGAAKRRWRWAVAAIVAFTLARGAVWAFLIPPLNAPDEPSHLIAISQVRENRGLPIAFILDPGTVSANSTPRDQAMLDYLAQFKYTHFRALPYESTQPPLYYIAAAILTYPLPNDPETLMYASRIVSALFGAATVFCVAMAAALLARGKLSLALGAPLGLTLLPQFGFQTATITNDIAMILAGAALCWAWAWAVRSPRVWLWAPALGLLTGLGMLAKLTLLVTIPASLLVLAWRARTFKPGWPRFIVEGALAGVVLAVTLGWWILRNMRVYGEPTGSRLMFSVIKGIYTTRLKLPADTSIIFPDWREFFWQSFASFWGVFGWRGVYLPPFFYELAALLTLLIVISGCYWLLRRWRARRFLPGEIGVPLVAFFLTFLGAVASYLAYTLTTDGSLQGRYIFVSLPALAILGAAAILYATPRKQLNRALGLVALAIMLVLQLTSWFFIGQS